MSEQRAVDLVNALDFYSELKPEARAFLLNAKPQTLEWLKDRRPDEIEALNKVSRLKVDRLGEIMNAWQTARTIRRFLFWTFVACGGSFLTMATLGQQLLAWLDAIRGIHR